ncbi:MAG: type II secretion system protein GspD [Vampirovibrionales bacterium]|nr:type II secretion system protein GspD [Vampirovibrionales bacterium]
MLTRPMTRNHRRPLAALVAVLLASSFLLGPGGGLSFAASKALTGELNISVTPAQMDQPVAIRGGRQVVNLSFRDVAVGDALRALGRKGGFNVIINDSVKGSVSVDLMGVTVQEALEAIKTQSDLSFETRGGDTLMVTSADSVRGQELQRTHSEVMTLRYANASVLANILNNSVFAPSSREQISGNTGGQIFKKITPDFRTNSLIVVGTESDLAIARDYIHALDTPRENRTWRLSHADAVDVATMLMSGLFNEGSPTFLMQAGGSGGGGGGGAGAGGAAVGGVQQVGQLPSALRIRTEEIKEGDGASKSNNTAGSGNLSSGAVVDALTLRSIIKTDQNASISPNGVILIPDSRLNTLTLFGTARQVELADRMIATLDRPAPQLVIETSMIELSEQAAKELTFNSSIMHRGVDFSINNPSVSGGPGLVRVGGGLPFASIGVPSDTNNPFSSLFRYSTSHAQVNRDFYYQLNAMVRNQRAKILANPSILTVSDQEALISIVDEVIKSVTVTFDAFSNSPLGSETNIGDVGLVLNLLPKVGPNGAISMRIRPTLSTVANVVTDVRGNTVTLLSKREALAQNVVLKDGETFVLGGLIQDSQTGEVNKIPGLGDLPIVGALARSSVRNKNRSELLILITPHIVNDDGAQLANQPGGAKAAPVSGAQDYLPPLRPTAPLSSDGLAPVREQSAIQPISQRLRPMTVRPAKGASSMQLTPRDMKNVDTSDEAIQRIIRQYAPQFDPKRDL